MFAIIHWSVFMTAALSPCQLILPLLSPWLIVFPHSNPDLPGSWFDDSFVIKTRTFGAWCYKIPNVTEILWFSRQVSEYTVFSLLPNGDESLRNLLNLCWPLLGLLFLPVRPPPELPWLGGASLLPLLWRGEWEDSSITTEQWWKAWSSTMSALTPPQKGRGGAHCSAPAWWGGVEVQVPMLFSTCTRWWRAVSCLAGIWSAFFPTQPAWGRDDLGHLLIIWQE